MSVIGNAHLLALLSVKVDTAVCANAPPEAVTPYARLALEHMRELKATRASKDGGNLTGNTPAEVMAALFMKIGAVKKQEAPALPEGKVVEIATKEGGEMNGNPVKDNIFAI